MTKIMIGGKGVSISDFEARLAQHMIPRIEGDMYKSQRAHMNKLARTIEQVALAEADKLFPKVVQIIEREDGSGGHFLGFGFEDLMDGPLEAHFQNEAQHGSHITWDSLTLAYQKHKDSRYPGSSDSMFWYTGRLRAYFRNNANSIIDNRFGGVSVKMGSTTNQETAYTRDYIAANYKKWEKKLAGDSAENILLGSMEIQIFPKIAKHLMPMLSSHRWSDVGSWGQQGNFERAMMPNSDGAKATVANKLTNSNGSYRPLVLPVVQFWLAVRIPNAIFRRLKEYFRRAAIEI